MMEFQKEDWKQMLDNADNLIKKTMQDLFAFQSIKNAVEKELKRFPEEKK